MSNRRVDVANSVEIAWIHSSTSLAKEVTKESYSSQSLDFAGFSAGEDVNSPTLIVVIEPRIFIRECLTQCLRLVLGYSVTSFPSVDAFLAVSDSLSASVIILSNADKPAAAAVRRQLFLLKQARNQVPTIILNDLDDPDEVMGALNGGARGYIPTSVPLQVAIEAMRLVKAGGVFVPASSLVSMRDTKPTKTPDQAAKCGPFTTRQAAVVEALCRGKANKVIAYELDMRESTVKVHVRNIMKKLKAKNRTEVAFITSNLMRSQNV